jgi:F-type H+-transporting ATPase subunit epsilon
MFRLSIVTPEKVAYDADIRSLIVPGADGYLGVLSQHAPLISALRPGMITFRDAEDEVHSLAVTNGFLEVSNNVATVLADAVEEAEEIDIERAREALKRANSALGAFREGEATDIDIHEVHASLERAKNRIRVYERTH